MSFTCLYYKISALYICGLYDLDNGKLKVRHQGLKLKVLLK